ncbi:hypothetical protein L6164_000401 [Bauhinia variegata]|uniref:Uncharacterized protein n=1 Tax=Bauhinia variegata TaxID=167791 RepID=A0ACB9Q8M4_BAUVA|nr:hypothetical protein L6164_000401 [Bauhinia variegata]
MIQLLFLVLFAEGVLAFLLLVKIGPLRDLVIKSLDQLKMGKGPATVKTIAGFTLFLGFIIDRMHHYLGKLINLRSNAGASKEELEKLQKEKVLLREMEEQASKTVKQLEEEISGLTESLKKAKLECEEKDQRVETAEVHVVSLQKQAADLLLEYDRLLEDNQNLQAQVTGR